MDRDDERMTYLEDMIKSKDAALMSISKKLDVLIDERRALRKLPESSRIGLMLKETEEDMTEMRKREDRLVADIVEQKAELRQLKNLKEPADVLVPAQGINHHHYYYFHLHILL